MGQNGLNRNGGCSRGNTGIIIVLKMKKVIAIGYSDQGIIKPINHINGLFMDFLREKDLCV